MAFINNQRGRANRLAVALLTGSVRFLDSIFVLEGLLEQQTVLNPAEIMTDTAGSDLFIAP